MISFTLVNKSIFFHIVIIPSNMYGKKKLRCFARNTEQDASSSDEDDVLDHAT